MQDDDLYDLASMTKLLAATPALLRLQAGHKFSPDSALGQYFPFLRGTNKAGLKMRDVLAHQAGLQAWIPFWKELRRRTATCAAAGSGPIHRRASRCRRRGGCGRGKRLAGPHLPGNRGVAAERQAGLRVLRPVVHPVSRAGAGPHRAAARCLFAKEVYAPLGATTLGFRPTNRFPLKRIVPTEVDSAFRRQLLHGTVHDEGAALLGGLSGHAGLFGDANDVAKLAQTYAWGGRYGGQQLFDQAVLADWTRCQFCPDNRRALAFDRPAANPAVNSAKSASPAQLRAHRLHGHLLLGGAGEGFGGGAAHEPGAPHAAE